LFLGLFFGFSYRSKTAENQADWAKKEKSGKRGKANKIKALRKMQIVDNFFILPDLRTEKGRKSGKLRSNYNLKRGFATSFLPLFFFFWLLFAIKNRFD